MLTSEKVKSPMNIEISTPKTFCNFGYNFFKTSHFNHFYQDFGHKLRIISGNPDSTRTPLTRTKCHCNQPKLYQRSKMRPEQNTALNAKTKQFITVKMSGNVLKQVSRTESNRCYGSAFHNCKNIKLCIKIVGQNTLNAMSGKFTNTQAARMSRREAVEQRRQRMQLG